MKQTVRMLKTLLGVDEGKIYPDTYHAGETYAIGDDLLKCFIELGAVEMAGESPASPVEARETKVVFPEETKPAKPLEKMSKAELVTHAQNTHGLELVPDTMTLKQRIAAIHGRKPA